MNHLTLHLRDGLGLAAEVELSCRLDVVEVVYDGVPRAVFARDVLREWLTYPEGAVMADDVSLFLSRDGMLLRIDPVVAGWPLSQHELAQLWRLL